LFELSSDLEIEFSNWNYISCIGVEEECRKGNRNIKLDSEGDLRINNPFGSYLTGKVKLNSRFGRIFKQIYNDLIDNDLLQYYARIVKMNERFYDETLVCEVQISVPFETYLQYDFGKVIYPNVTYSLMSGQDVNVDRVNSVIVNRKTLRIVNMRTFWFDEAN